MCFATLANACLLPTKVANGFPLTGLVVRSASPSGPTQTAQPVDDEDFAARLREWTARPCS